MYYSKTRYSELQFFLDIDYLKVHGILKYAEVLNKSTSKKLNLVFTGHWSKRKFNIMYYRVTNIL